LVAFHRIYESGVAQLLGQGFGGLGASWRGKNDELALLGDRFGKLNEGGQGPFRSGPKVGAGNDGDAEGVAGGGPFRSFEVGGLEGINPQRGDEEQVVVYLMLDGAGLADDLDGMREESCEIFGRVAQSLPDPGFRESQGRRILVPCDGGVEGQAAVGENFGEFSGRVGRLIGEDLVDPGNFTPDRGNLGRGEDDHGFVGVGPQDGADGGDTEAGLRNRGRRSDREIFPLDFERGGFCDGFNLLRVGHGGMLVREFWKVTRER